jgi:osmotically-inducible protein OsmY
MKKALILLAISSVSLIFADQYTQTYQQARVNYPNGYSPTYSSCTARDGGGTQDLRDRQDIRIRTDQRGGGQKVDSDDQDNDDFDDQDDINQVSPVDRDIGKKIRDAISSGWFSKGFQGVAVRVNNGNVVLRGFVDSEDNKKKVEDTVRKIDGVKNVDNQIRVKQNRDDARMQNRDSAVQDYAAKPEDRQLNARIRERLENSGVRGREALVIKTADGIVIISGPIDRQEDSQRLQNLIRGIEGVRSVNNQLDVKNK